MNKILSTATQPAKNVQPVQQTKESIPVSTESTQSQANDVFEKPEVPSMQSARESPKSCCKVKSHEHCEIVFACYECKDTYCYICLDAHRSHTLIYFKDPHMVLNYNNINHVVVGNPKSPAQEIINTTSRTGPQTNTANMTPAFDVYFAQNKFTKERVVVKVIKDFKQRPPEFKDCLMLQLSNQIKLQQVWKVRNLIQMSSYSIVNNNLYIVSEYCLENLRKRIEWVQQLGARNAPLQINLALDEYIDTGDALKALTMADRYKTFIVLVLVHDCLKILKMLALLRPNDAICFSVDNLLLKNGHLILSDAFISKSKLKREIQLSGNKRLDFLSSSKTMPESLSQKLWQLQNLQFIGRLACQMLSDTKVEGENPTKMLLNQKVRSSPLFSVIDQIYTHTMTPTRLNEHEIYPFICQIKLQIKTLMAVDVPMSYKALLSLCNYTEIDSCYDQSRVNSKVQETKEHPFQIQVVLLLYDGRIAVSGGPMRFEILLYNHLLSKRDLQNGQGRNDSLHVVDSIDTQGMQVHHLLEVQKQFLIAVGPCSQFIIYHNQLQPVSQHFERVINTESNQNTQNLGTSADIIQIMQLRQFQHLSQKKVWFVSINYLYQVCLIEFSFVITNQKIEAQQVSLRRLYTETIQDDELQPFSLSLLLNSKPEVNKSEQEVYSEIIIGCASGTILVFDIKTLKRPIAVVAGVQVPGSSSNRMLTQSPPQSLQENRRLSVKEIEPILYINECLGQNQKNLVYFSTLNGIVYLMNHRSKSKLLRVDLNHISDIPGMRITSANVVYSMIPYSKFDKDKCPLLLIHDRNNGLFILNIVTLDKVQVLEKEQVNADTKTILRSKIKPLSNWRGSNCSLNSNESLSDSEGGTAEDLKQIDQFSVTPYKSSEMARLKNCSFCPALATPNPQGLVILTSTRQILVVFQHMLKVVCYESSTKEKPLPLEYEFSFFKVKHYLQELFSFEAKRKRKVIAIQKKKLLDSSGNSHNK